VTTPPGALTPTTPGGNLERPLDICATVGVNGASYVWRGTSYDEDLTDRIEEALAHPGFALLDVWELCTAYFVRSNKVSRKGLDELLDRLAFPRGVLHRRNLPEYAAAYREAAREMPSGLAPRPIESRFRSALAAPISLVVAGSAGGKVRSAARLIAQAAILSGLWAAQRDDYPVTVKTGHSVAELVISPDPIDFSGVSRPDGLVIVSEDGLKAARGLLGAMAPTATVVVTPELGAVDTPARVLAFDGARAPTRISKTDLALGALAATVTRLGLFPVEALEAATEGDPYADRDLEAIRTGLGLAAGWA
jgi:Pyruvate/2-oxoacid:ferredoxin oxidoreductase gamma subunit